MWKMVTVLLLSVISAGAQAQTEWQLRKDEDGIKVYTASTPNSNFKSVKVELTLKAKQSQLVSFLLDIGRQHDWIYNNKGAELVKKISGNELIAYSEYSVPWPCSNRDYVSHITIAQQSPQFLTIDARAEPDMVPVKPGRVRVTHSTAHWDVTTLNNDMLQIVYTVHCDPAGAVPAWLANIFLTKAPLQTFRKLRDEVTDPQYQNAHLAFIKD